MKLSAATVSVLSYISIVLLQCHAARSEPPSSKIFASELLPVVTEVLNSKNLSTQNVVFSPIAINTTLALVYLGAVNYVRNQTRKVLKLAQDDKAEVARKYGQFFKFLYRKALANDSATHLEMAHQLYVRTVFRILPEYKSLVRQNFHCEFQKLYEKRFEDDINKWIEKRTKNKIKNLLKPKRHYLHSAPVLVNAIYFKAKWRYPFKELRRKRDCLKFVTLPQLRATALKLPFKDSKISMTIIRPNESKDFKTLRNHLKGIDLSEIFLNQPGAPPQETDIVIPKFRLEFNIDLKGTLMKFGCFSMFTALSTLDDMYGNDIGHSIPTIRQKIVLEVNDDGVEAAAATYTHDTAMSENVPQFSNFPFVFFINDKANVYFAGYVDRHVRFSSAIRSF